MRPSLSLCVLALTAVAVSATAQTSRTVARTIVRASDSIYSTGDLTADQQVLQVLNRLTFGPRPGDVQAVRAMGIDAWIDRQLHPDNINDDTFAATLAAFPVLTENQSDLAAEYTDFVRDRLILKQARKDTTQATAADTAAVKKIVRGQVRIVQQLNASRVARAVGSDRQLLEVMTDFWENHFNIYARKGAVEPYYLVDFDRTIRDHALGKFRDLLGAVAHSPAMLFYLDNAESRANPGQPTLPREGRNGMTYAPRDPQRAQLRAMRLRARNPAKAQQPPKGLNENYGRELLELHTLGVDGGYTQQDVINVARALTGWTIRPPRQGGGFIFRPEWHDAAEKVILGHTLPAGRGEADGEEVLDLIARHPSTAHFIALKLARRLVSDSPSTALVERAAHTFLTTNGDMREVVRTIVTSPEFFSHTAFRSKVKSPFEVVVSAARAVAARPDTTMRSAQVVAYLGQPIFGHQAPDGWPEIGGSWMNTGAILTRINFGIAVAANRLPGATLAGLPWADSVRTAPRSQQVDMVVQHVLGGAVSPDTRKVLMSGTNPLASNPAIANAAIPDSTAAESGEGADVDAMTAMTSTPAKRKNVSRSKATNRAPLGGTFPPTSGVAQIVGLALGSPEFQRR